MKSKLIKHANNANRAKHVNNARYKWIDKIRKWRKKMIKYANDAKHTNEARDANYAKIRN